MLFVVFVDHENSYYSVSTLERRRPKHDKHRRHSGGKITGVKNQTVQSGNYSRLVKQLVTELDCLGLRWCS